MRPDAATGERHFLKVWPYTWASMRWFVAAFVALTAAFTLSGLAVVEWFEPSRVGEAEADVSVWFEEHRTDTWNTVAELGSVPSNTPVKIGLMAAAALVFPLVLKRWNDWAFLLGALLLEVSVYGLSSYLVGRPRPPVERLAEAPTQSWPSGHVAAALTFYVGLVIIVRWHTKSPVGRAAAWIVGGLIVAGMFFSRLYLGMHYVSDEVAGLALGAACLLIAHRIAESGLEQTLAENPDRAPAQTTTLSQIQS